MVKGEKGERTKYYNGNVDRAQNAELICLFEEAGFALRVRVWKRGPREDETGHGRNYIRCENLFLKQTSRHDLPLER